MSGKILVFYPHNFFEQGTGSHRRIRELLEYFRERQYVVDLFSLNGYTNTWSEKDRQRDDLFRRVHLFDWRLTWRDRAADLLRTRLGRLPDLALPGMIRKFRGVLASDDYHHVLISYVFWANLIDRSTAVSTVVDLHDFVTLNYHDLKTAPYDLGRMFRDEVSAIRRFDRALSISRQETLMLERFCQGTEFVDLPISFPERFQDVGDCRFDLLFVGAGDNRFNREGLEWFIEKVYPLIEPAPRVAVAGSVCEHFRESPDLHLLGHVAGDLDEIYRRSRVAICPILGGTGLKIKLVEALSFGRPVVATELCAAEESFRGESGCIAVRNEADFARAIARLLTDDEHYRRTRTQAMKRFRDRFSREVCWSRLDSVFEDARGGRRS